MRNLTLTVAAVCVIATFVGCAQKRPQMFPNSKYNSSSPTRLQSDIDYCMSLADEYVQQPNKYGEVLKKGAIGGVVGAGTGAVAGSIYGNAGRGTGAGAAVGAIIGVLQGLYEVSEDSPSYQRFVERCLQNKGYEIVGWN